eukprot:3425634-Amphidinium_carterae.1
MHGAWPRAIESNSKSWNPCLHVICSHAPALFKCMHTSPSSKSQTSLAVWLMQVPDSNKNL